MSSLVSGLDNIAKKNTMNIGENSHAQHAWTHADFEHNLVQLYFQLVRIPKYSHEKMEAVTGIYKNLVNSSIKQERNSDGSPSKPHQSWNSHPIQGWTPDFIPQVLQESIDENYFDMNVPISGNEGIYWSHQLANREGIITGISGGSTFAVAMKIAKEASDGSNILCMLADTAERYLSSVLFEKIDSEMNEEEIRIFNSI